ncbi:MAG: porin [Methylococcales bacterium]|nr:porin [Methylococcales bacterium]
MKLSKRTLAITVALTTGASSSAFAINLYVDTKTEQIFAKPGPNRVLMGSFVKEEEQSAKKQTSESAIAPPKESVTAETKSKESMEAEIAAIKADLENKTQELKTLDNQVNKPEEKAAMAKKGILPAGVTYGKRGFEFKTDDGKFSLAIQNRLQLRYATPFDADPRTLSDLEQDKSSFMVRRARTKLSGNLYWPYLKYYLQYDWSQPVLRDANLTLDKFKWAEFRAGRGKVQYNDERVTSSGNQQFVNRSIVNDVFTVDRQQGVDIKGNLFPKEWYDFSYYAGVYSGQGIGQRLNDDDNMMWSGRLQWNPLGGEMPFSQSDIEFHKEPNLNFAFAANTNQSPCTAFETDTNSCRALTGFTVGRAGQYRVNQMMQETRFKWQGLSIQQETHWKDITDTLRPQTDQFRQINLMGGYVQAGYFFHNLIDIIPKNLEFAGRYAYVDKYSTSRTTTIGSQTETSGVMTYFFNGHSNKVNFQVSRLTAANNILRGDNMRYWMQWDVSF